MIEALRQAVERVQRRSEEEQLHIARLIELELEDEAWEESPDVRLAFDAAHAEVASGDTMDYEKYRRERHEREPAR